MIHQHSNHSQAWKEISKGHWRRPLVGMEPYFVFFGDLTKSMVNGREHYVIFSAVKLEASDPVWLTREYS